MNRLGLPRGGAGPVQVDAVTLFEVRLRLAGDDGRQVEHHVGPIGDEGFDVARIGDVDLDDVDSERGAVGILGRYHIREVEMVDRPATGDPSRTSRSVNLRPTMPAAPVTRIRTAQSPPT